MGNVKVYIEEFLNEYNKVNTALLINKEISLSALRDMARRLNEDSNGGYNFNVEENDSKLLLSIKEWVESIK